MEGCRSLSILFYEDIISALKVACETCVPLKKKNFYKFWWDEELQLLKQSSIDKHKIWAIHNKPKSGSIYREMMKAKIEYKAER